MDDDDSVRTKLVRVVDQFGACACVGQFSSGEGAVAQLPAALPEV